MLLLPSLISAKLLISLLVSGWTMAWNVSKATKITDDSLAFHMTIC